MTRQCRPSRTAWASGGADGRRAQKEVPMGGPAQFRQREPLISGPTAGMRKVKSRRGKRVALTYREIISGSLRNRHLAKWRFLRFTVAVTVNYPICRVIRIYVHPFSGQRSRPAAARSPALSERGRGYLPYTRYSVNLRPASSWPHPSRR